MSRLERSFRYLLAWGTVAASATTLGAQRPVADAALRSGTLSFHGHATVGDFVGTTSSVTGVIVASSDYGATTGWVEAPVATLVTGNDRRDRDLRASMAVERFPTMRFALSGVTVVTSASLGAAESTAVLLHGTLVIHGVARRVELPATIVREGDTTRVTTTFPLDLREYEIGGLTKMFGMLRMQPGIDVRVDLRFVDGRPVLSGAP